MDPPPVRKRGRPRKEDRKRRGRKPNPDKGKIFSEELKKTSVVQDDKSKKVDGVVKEDNMKDTSPELNTADDKNADKKKKFSREEETWSLEKVKAMITSSQLNCADCRKPDKRKKFTEEKTTSNGVEGKTKETSLQLNSADDKKTNKRRKICELKTASKTASNLDKGKRKKACEEPKTAINVDKVETTEISPQLHSDDAKKEDITKEVSPNLECNTVSINEGSTKEISPNLECNTVSTTEVSDKTKSIILHEIDSSEKKEADNSTETAAEQSTPQNNEADNTKKDISEFNIADKSKPDEIMTILREFNNVSTKGPGTESVCTMQSPIPESKASVNVVKQYSVDSGTENYSQSEHASLSSPSSDIRMVMKLPECYVLLHRLTVEDIHRSYASDSEKEITDDVRSKTEELVRKTEEAVDMYEQQVTYRKNGTKRPMRSPSKIRHDVFELYKRKRQCFINRRNRVSLSDNSLDWSQDEFKTASDSGKKKKRLKRGRKYELDFEWSPNVTNNTVQSTRKLRRHVRRPVIDSDSSNEEVEVLFNIYMKEFNDNTTSSKSAIQNAVPSAGNCTYEHVDKSAFNSSGSDLSMKQNQNSSQITSINSNSSLHNSDHSSEDLVSSIIRDMNKIKGENIKTSFNHKMQSFVSNNVMTKPVKRGRKRLMVSSSENKKIGNDVDVEVDILLCDMIKTVSAQVKQMDGSKKAFSKVCKWCSTPFATNKESEIMCAICCDLGKGKFHRTNSNNKKGLKPLNTKLCKEGKVIKRKNNTMSRVLKKLPKSEMQRLIYAEKTDKMSFEKGYNHCKSFNTPRDTKESDINSDGNNSVLSNKISIKTNEEKKKSDQPKTQRQHKEDGTSYVSSKQKQGIRSLVNLLQKKAITATSNKIEKFGEDNSFVLKNVDKGLFQITFPGSHEKSDTLDKSQTMQRSEKISTHGEKVIGKKCVPSSNATEFETAVSEKHDTYLFPPIPTVIVSNYCNDTSGLNLSHTYFQNEITHKHALKNSASLLQSKGKTDSSKTVSNIINVTNTIPYQNSCLPTSSLLPSNTSLTITTIPINKTMNQVLPFTSNSQPIISSLITSTPKNVTLMPVVSSVVHLSDNTLTEPNVVKRTVSTNSDIFPSNNFVNSQNLGIKITHVSSEKTYEHMNTDDVEVNVEIPLKPKISAPNSESKSNENIMDTDINSKQNSRSLVIVENKSKLDLTTDELAEQAHNHSLKQSDKPSENKESAISSAMDVLGAVSILAVIDLEKNPHSGLNFRIQVTKGNLAKLTSEKNTSPEQSEKIASCQYNLQVLNIAKRYLSLYGSFAKVSDFLLRKAKMIQIKKEIISEESNQSSCMYSQSNNLLSNNGVEDSRTLEMSPSPVSNKLENFSSCRLNEQAASVNHIQRLQSQIAAIHNTQVPHYETGGTVHHFPVEQIAALPSTIAAPTPITPRNDYMGGESRETPSRGSGPRTPARPESAASQSEEQSLVQIKKEHLEAASSPPSQCVYSQNTTLPQISSQLTVIPEMPSLNISEHSISNTTVHQIPVSNTNQLFTNQANLQLQPVEVASNRTISYNSNPNYSDVLVNIATKHQVNPPVPSPEIRQNRQVLLGQQMYIQNELRMSGKQPVPSINNQFVIRPPFSSANTGGTVIVNNSQLGQNALLTNVSNQQFYTSNQVSQLYYPPSCQITCVPSNTSTVSITATPNQQADVSPDQMVCAVCKSQATLRCKQCARVAYCNTTCAKTYWHQKHKMECKPLPS